MTKIIPDEKIGPFLVRARAVKGGFASVVIEGDKAQRFDGFETEALALEAARAYATQQVAERRPPPRATTVRRATREGDRRSLADLIARFRSHFPQGFADPAYPPAERTYKDDARAGLAAAVTLDQALFADAAQASAARSVFSTNMLTPFENARVREALGGAEGPAFLQGCAQVARGDIKQGLATIDATVRPHGAPSWTIATFLPAMWNPDACMLMKITATRQVAGWLGHGFDTAYTPALNADTYAECMAFAEGLRSDLADLRPRDLIDVQSFIWVVTSYK